MLQITRVEKVYPGFSLATGPLEVRAGELVALVGPNGTGKTTLMRSLLGIIRPDVLEFTLDGKRVPPGSPFPRQVIGYVPEEPVLFESMTVSRLLQFVSGFYPEWDAKTALDLLDRFRVDSRKKIRTLSKGMRTKVLLVMALARSARILFLDEPTSGLDPVSRDELWDFIGDLFRRETIQTMIVSTHQLDEVQQFCNRAIFLKNGHIVYDEHNFSKTQLRELFGAAPSRSFACK